MNDFLYTKVLNDELTLARNSEEEFWKILRKKTNYKNANSEYFGHKDNYIGAENIYSIEEKISLLQDLEYRLKPKSDDPSKGERITDAPGFGCTRLSPPYEEIGFDKNYFNFLNSFIKPDNIIADYGGDLGLFLYFLKDCKRKILVEKNGVEDIIPSNINYIDADNFSEKCNFIFSYHTLEHLTNPEQWIEQMCNLSEDAFIFGTPLNEIIDTSIHHYVYVELEILKKIFKRLNKIFFYHISHHNLDIHCIVINNNKFLKEIYQNEFLKNNFIPVKEF